MKMEVESKYLKTAFSLHKQMGMGPFKRKFKITTISDMMITTLRTNSQPELTFIVGYQSIS